MPHDLRPGEFPALGMMLLVHKGPSVSSGSRGRAPILLGAPPARLGRGAAFHVALGAPIHEVVQVREDLFRHADAEVITPAPDHRVEFVAQGHRGGAHMLAPEPFQLPLELPDGSGLGLISSLMWLYSAGHTETRTSVPLARGGR
jgi:hypothetical protein